MSADEFDELYRQVDNQVQRVCRDICDGNIEIKPKQERIKDMQGNRRNACRYCTYRSICMFVLHLKGADMNRCDPGFCTEINGAIKM